MKPDLVIWRGKTLTLALTLPCGEMYTVHSKNMLKVLAAQTAIHCPVPRERGPLGPGCFMLYFELDNGYLCKFIANPAENQWTLATACGPDGEVDAIETRGISTFFTTMTIEQSMPFGALFGVSTTGTRAGRANVTADFLEFESRVLEKIVKYTKTRA